VHRELNWAQRQRRTEADFIAAREFCQVGAELVPWKLIREICARPLPTISTSLDLTSSLAHHLLHTNLPIPPPLLYNPFILSDVRLAIDEKTFLCTNLTASKSSEDRVGSLDDRAERVVPSRPYDTL
jgi:hypothetical protein